MFKEQKVLSQLAVIDHTALDRQSPPHPGSICASGNLVLCTLMFFSFLFCSHTFVLPPGLSSHSAGAWLVRMFFLDCCLRVQENRGLGRQAEERKWQFPPSFPLSRRIQGAAEGTRDGKPEPETSPFQTPRVSWDPFSSQFHS